MFDIKLIFAVILVALNVGEIFGHGYMIDPPSRSSAWRRGFNTSINYDDNGVYCGGYGAQFSINRGKCGPCGDNMKHRVPRANENGGFYGKGVIVATYNESSKFKVSIQIDANHKGTFTFSLCPLLSNEAETEECFDKYPLKFSNGGNKYTLQSKKRGLYNMTLVLPEGLICEHCSLRWHWRAANNWGDCGNGKGAVGCGNQETFRNCADIKIVNVY